MAELYAVAPWIALAAIAVFDLGVILGVIHR